MSLLITAADIGEQFVTRNDKIVKLVRYCHDHFYPCKFERPEGGELTTQPNGRTMNDIDDSPGDVLDRFEVAPVIPEAERVTAEEIRAWHVVHGLAEAETPCTSGPVEDEVNHPSHYKQGSIECIEAIRAALTPEEFRGYCKGNMLKYVWREKHKQQDVAIEKAVWYANTMLGKAND